MSFGTKVNIKVKFKDPTLEPELYPDDKDMMDRLTDNLRKEITQFLEDTEDYEGQVSRVRETVAPEYSKGVGGFLVGILTAEISSKNIKSMMNFLGDRLSGKSIELELEAHEKKLKIKVSNQQDLATAIQAAKDFIGTP